MLLELLKDKQITFERTYAAPIADVWAAWTRPELLRQWWGVEKTTIPECEVDLAVGGRIRIVMEAGEGMGKYAGTRWPLEGTFTEIDAPHRLVYAARSWTEGDERSSISHVNEVDIREEGGATVVNLRIGIEEVGPGVKSKVAVLGMKSGYKAQFDNLEGLLAR
ncbi:SRPBCC domain-containing protein [Euzebya sp.]|uniref:SRPBCC family protein n=1 Tax=Euzebya sp. TaxID=1971409 RepID=UPI0035193ACA